MQLEGLLMLRENTRAEYLVDRNNAIRVRLHTGTMQRVNEQLLKAIARCEKSIAASDIRHSEEKTTVLTTLPERYGTVDELPWNFCKRMPPYSGEPKDGSIFSVLRKFFGNVVSTRLTESCALEALRSVFHGKALEVLDAATDYTGDAPVAMIDVVRDLEQTFGSLVEPHKARLMANSLVRTSDESIKAFQLRVLELAKMATRNEFPVSRRHESQQDIMESVILANIRKDHRFRIQERIRVCNLQGANKMTVRDLVNTIKEMEEQEGGLGRAEFVGPVGSSGEAKSILQGRFDTAFNVQDVIQALKDDPGVANAISSARARHPSAKNVQIQPTPQVRQRSQSGDRFSRGDRFVPLANDERYVYDNQRQAVRRFRSPSNERAQPNPAAGYGRRPSQSPSRALSPRIDIKSLGISRATQCYKCGLEGHNMRQTECPLYPYILTSRCTACHTGGHLSSNCPVHASKNV